LIHDRSYLFRPIYTSPFEIDFEISERIENAYCYVLAKGVLIQSKNIEIRRSKKIRERFDFSKRSEMVSSVDVIIYYIAQDGQLISGLVKVPFEKLLPNNVKN
jgi:hypothetical protein